jgi:hypothetical protein
VGRLSEVYGWENEIGYSSQLAKSAQPKAVTFTPVLALLQAPDKSGDAINNTLNTCLNTFSNLLKCC